MSDPNTKPTEQALVDALNTICSLHSVEKEHAFPLSADNHVRLRFDAQPTKSELRKLIAFLKLIVDGSPEVAGDRRPIHLRLGTNGSAPPAIEQQ